MVKKKIIWPILALTAAVMMAGCSDKNTEQEVPSMGTESLATDPVPIQQQAQKEETSAQTEKETEAETEVPQTETPEKSLDELQDLFREGGRSGRMQYEIITSDGKQSGEGTFLSNDGTFELQEEGIAIAYADGDGSYVNAKSGGWQEGTLLYRDMFDPFREENGVSIGEVNGEGANRVYKLSLSDTTQVTGEAVLPVCLWYKDVKISPSAAAYYMDGAGNLTRVDVSLAFTGLKDGMNVEGKYNAVFSIDGITEENIVVPDSVLSEIYPDYTPGNLTEELYTNDLFDLKIAGKGYITFDLSTTEAMNQQNKENGNGYTAEAVGECDGGIISISSASFGASGNIADALQKYLKNCNAENIGAAETAQVLENEVMRCSADINGTATYTYCLKSSSRILFITIYYKDSVTVDEILSHFYHTWEDVDWVEASWTLDGKYTVRTPKNYRIVEEDSSDYYLCLKKADMEEVNVFVLSNTTIEEEIASDAAGDEGDLNELLLQEETDINGNYAIYAVIREQSQTSQYVTYELLQQTENDVIKYFVVSLSDNGEFKDELLSIAATMTTMANTEMLQEEAASEITTEGTEAVPEN